MELLIGSDPEVFAKRDGKYVSAHNMVPGSKEAPHVVNDGAVQVDGMALEFNINPAATEKEFLYNLDSVMGQLKAMVPGIELAADPVAEFDHQYMLDQPEEAKELGCDPDYNAWANGAVNPKPDGEVDFRTGAGHIHIGLWPPGHEPGNHEKVALEVVKQLDFYLGLPSLVFDKDTRRREMYGAAGAYRLKPYGVEYRVLSNKWLSSVALRRWVFRSTKKAIMALHSGERLRNRYGSVERIINKSQVTAAKEICRAAGIQIPKPPLIRRALHVG